MITQTFDYDFIKEVCVTPSVWPHISDDNCAIDEFTPSDSMIYLMVEDKGEKMGFFGLSAVNTICYEIHTTMLPKAWGKTLRYTKEVLDWIFTNTGCLKVVTFVPETNKKALNLALKTGLKTEGFIDKSFLKGGVLIGQYLLGISKGDLCL